MDVKLPEQFAGDQVLESDSLANDSLSISN